MAASGIVVVRGERRRRSYTPEEIRERLHARLAEARGGTPPTGSTDGTRGAGTAEPGPS